MPDFGKLEDEAEAEAKQEEPGLEKKLEPKVEAEAKTEEDKLRDQL